MVEVLKGVYGLGNGGSRLGNSGSGLGNGGSGMMNIMSQEVVQCFSRTCQFIVCAMFPVICIQFLYMVARTTSGVLSCHSFVGVLKYVFSSTGQWRLPCFHIFWY